MIYSFCKFWDTYKVCPIIPKDDFPYYQEIKEKLSDKYYLTNEQFESMFFENGNIWETKQWPFGLCHRDAMIDTIKEMVFFSALMRLNIKESKNGKEREVRIPMNIKWKWYKINEHDLHRRETLENEEAKKNQKWRKKSEWPIWFIILMLAYLKSIGTFHW